MAREKAARFKYHSTASACYGLIGIGLRVLGTDRH